MRVLLALAAFAVLTLSCVSGDPAPGVEFRGHRYLVGGPGGVQITEDDLEAIGEVQSIDEPSSVTSLTAYQLKGVDPSGLFVMLSASPTTTRRYLLIYRFEAVPRKSAPDESPEVAQARFVYAFPGLCRYYPTVPCPP